VKLLHRIVKSFRRVVLFALLPPSAFGQIASTTTLTSSSPTLVLPGSLTLTSAVNQPTVAGGVPTGNVNFFYDGTNSLGNAPLKILPATQMFPSSPTASQVFANSNYNAVVSVAFPTYGAVGILGFLPSPTQPPPATELGIATFYGHGASLFGKSTTTYLAPTSTIVQNSFAPSVSTGDFNHDGLPDFIVSGFGGNFGYEYDVLIANANGTFTPINPIQDSISCNCDIPQADFIAIDDFNGDGYSDIAHLSLATNPTVSWTLEVLLNNASQNSVTFNAKEQSLPSNFCAVAMTTGHFTSSGHVDIAILGFIDPDASDDDCLPETMIPSTILMYLGNGDGTFTPGKQVGLAVPASAITSADFDKDGNLDVVVANQSTNPDTATGTIMVLRGDGNGNLALPQANDVVQVGPAPSQLVIADVNGDSFPDILVSDQEEGSLRLASNDGTGHFPQTATTIYTTTEVSEDDGLQNFAIGDFNSDGLPDIVVLNYGNFPGFEDNVSETDALLNSASAQATLTTAPMTLPAGSHTLTANFAGPPVDTNFAASTSAGVLVAVSQTPSTLTWGQPAAIQYGTPLSTVQLNATSSVPGNTTYLPASGTILSPGTTTIAAAFMPTDSFDYTAASATQSITVPTPSFSTVSPAMAKLGDPNTTITVTGQGLVNGASVRWNGTALATTFVDLNHLTAVIPASLLLVVGNSTITVADPGNLAVGGAQAFTVVAQPPTASVASPSTATADEDSMVTLTVGSYPVDVTATVTLAFAPAQANGPVDPMVKFDNNTLTTAPYSIPANTVAVIPPYAYQTGTTAGTITFTIQLTAAGTNVPPANPTPLVVTVPAAPPLLMSPTLTRSGNSLTLVIDGISTPRDMTSATFHFTPISGKSFKTSDITVPLSTAYATFYQSPESVPNGTTFIYTQPFSLDSAATDVAAVTVTLSNSQGASQTLTAH
jgi:FG-GAP-like repeat